MFDIGMTTIHSVSQLRNLLNELMLGKTAIFANTHHKILCFQAMTETSTYQVVHNISYKETIVNIINLHHDTDTSEAIVVGLSRLVNKNDIINLGNTLCQK